MLMGIIMPHKLTEVGPDFLLAGTTWPCANIRGNLDALFCGAPPLRFDWNQALYSPGYLRLAKQRSDSC
jgi:hypothetical protein